ncbi:CoA transferase [Nonomuraea ferruginea]
MGDSVRYQVYPSADGHVLIMATERKFWERFCHAVERPDLLGDTPRRRGRRPRARRPPAARRADRDLPHP